jgi:hypothetical protein
MKDKEKTKWIGEIQDTVKRLADFKQIVAWSAVQLFSGGKLLSPGSCTMSLVSFLKYFSFLLPSPTRPREIIFEREVY